MEKTELINKDKAADIVLNLLQGRFEKQVLDGYSSPFTDIINEVVNEKRSQIRQIYSDMLEQTISGGGFKEAMLSEFRHKVAKNLVAKLEGSVEKAVESLRQDPTLRAKMILAIQDIIDTNQKD